MLTTLKSKALSLSIFFVMMLGGLPLFAQNRISVQRETYNDQETTAMVTPHKDQYNKNCALVVFHNVEPEGYGFKAQGAHAVNRTDKASGEKVIFLYLPEGTKRVEITHNDSSIGSLQYSFDNAPLESGQTYHVYLGQVFSGNQVGTQYLEFAVTPANATLEVEEDAVNAPGKYTPWQLDASGRATKALRYGNYNYRVSANDYHASAGVVQVNGTPQTEVVKLKPAYGYLTIRQTDDLEGATIFIDGRQAGQSQLNKYKLPSGSHVIKITKPLFKLYEQTVTINDEKENVLAPMLDPNFMRTTLRNPMAEASIYIREAKGDRLLGTGQWSGPLEPGDYLIISKRSGHRDAPKQITVSQNTGAAYEFTLPSPQPMYGSVDIKSNPSGAEILVDGKSVGRTPMVVNNLLCTNHTITLIRTGYNNYVQNITVTDGETKTINAMLTNICKVTVGGNANSGYNVYAGSQKLESVNGGYTVPRGTVITVYGSGYDQLNKRKTYTVSTNRHITMNLSPDRIHDNEFYIDLGGVYSGYWGMTVAMGFNTRFSWDSPAWFNMQADFDVPFSGNKYEYYCFFPDAIDYYYDSHCESNASFAAGARVGVSFPLGGIFRLTPQIGYKYTIGGGDERRPGEYNSDPYEDYSGFYVDDSDGNAGSLLVALRMNIYTGFRFGIFLSPEYQFKIHGDGFGASNLYGKCKNWSTGFVCKLGVSFNF